MKKIMIGCLLALGAGMTLAAGVQAPPALAAQSTAAPARPAHSVYPSAPADSRMEPSERDMIKARAERESPSFHQPGAVPKKGTRIEQRHDQNNRLTQVKVTPGSTEIPYTMDNRSDRPIDTSPASDSRSTLGTPKFIQFGW